MNAAIRSHMATGLAYIGQCPLCGISASSTSSAASLARYDNAEFSSPYINMRIGVVPGIRHLANSIFTQLAMAASGLGVTLVPNVSVRQMQPPALYRRLTDRADIVELSLVSRGGTQEPLAEQFLRIATP